MWKSFLNKSQFGENYALFVPYHQASRYESVCSLRLRLVRPDGTQLFSEMATVKLAGEPREDKSIRQLVSPREQSIRPDRSRDLQVDLQQRRPVSNRAATIGSIQEGSLSLAKESASSDQILDEHARLKIQQYEAQLAEMHTTFAPKNDRQQSSARALQQDISDLMPAIREVSRDRQKTLQRVTPAAHEVFAPEEPQHLERTTFNDDQSQSSIWTDTTDFRELRRTDASEAPAKIHSLSRPLRRATNPESSRRSTDEDSLQALQLARITE